MSEGSLLLVRHGRTAGNRHRFLGRADVPLDAVGRAHVRVIADVLAREPLHHVYSSPLLRAVSTAQPLARRRGLAVEIRAELSELDCGAWQGRLKAGPEGKLSKRDPQQRIPGGESLADAWGRISRFCDTVRPEAEAGSRCVVVGHYLTSQLLVAILLGATLDEALRSALYRPAPGSVYELRFGSGRWRPEAFRVTALANAL